ncbi:4-hydroxybutyrate CoA-transferase [Porphyromonas sp. CAG:1061]|nr:4-hydroxybutyrate CoA-transferase [Porphyromonas sp. CAG:1061]
MKGHKDLGIHTELLTPGVLELYQSGAITGSYKGVRPGVMTAAFTMGDEALYRFLGEHKVLEQYPVDWVNDPYVIGQNERMISINSCIELDLYGQVCAEKVGGQMFSGSGGQVDYVRGARLSKGGKSIIALPSTAKKGTLSRIVPMLGNGNVVTTGRNDVDYIVTEYGVAALAGRSELERAEALVAIAHPDFREELERSVWEQFPAKRFWSK